MPHAPQDALLAAVLRALDAERDESGKIIDPDPVRADIEKIITHGTAQKHDEASAQVSIFTGRNPSRGGTIPKFAEDDAQAAQHLGNFYAHLLDSLELAGKNVDLMADALSNDIEEYGYRLTRGKDGWTAEQGTYEEYVEPGFTGESKDRRGYRICYKDGKRVSCGHRDKGVMSAQRVAARKERQPDLGKLNDRLKVHAASHPINRHEMARANLALNLLKRHHGELAAHRLEELADGLERALGAVPEQEKVMVSKQLSMLHTMLDMVNNPQEKATREKKPAAAPQPGKVYNLGTDTLKVDPSRFQFKLNTDASGVTQELKSVKSFNPDFAGVLAVWRDPEDGQTYVVNGHHRHELASRLGHPNLAVRYVTAGSAKEARAIGALINIAEGRGTATDAAKFMRDSGASPEELAQRGVSLNGKLAADAAALTRLSDRQFDRVARGLLDENKALAVARHLGDHNLQDQLFSLLDKREDGGKDLPLRVVEEMAREMAATPAQTKTEKSLFGDIESTESLFVPRNELKSHIRNELSREVADFLAVSSKRRAERVGSAGNVLDTEKNREIAQKAEQAKNVFDTLVNSKGAISDAINTSAAEYAKATTRSQKDAIRKQVLTAAKEAVVRELDGPTQQAGTGPGGQGSPGSGEAQPGAKPDATPADPGRGGAGEGGLTTKPESVETRLFRDSLSGSLKDTGSLPLVLTGDENATIANIRRDHPDLKPYDVGTNLDKAMRQVAARHRVPWATVEEAITSTDQDDRRNLARLTREALATMSGEVNGDKKLLLHNLAPLAKYGATDFLSSLHGISGSHDRNQRKESAVVLLGSDHGLTIPAGRRPIRTPDLDEDPRLIHPPHVQKQISAAQERYTNRDTTASGGGLFGGDDIQGRAGFGKLPDGTAVLIVEGDDAGKTGKIVREKTPNGTERVALRIDGREGLTTPTHTAVEPLNPALSWRTPAGSGAATKQVDLWNKPPSADQPKPEDAPGFTGVAANGVRYVDGVAQKGEEDDKAGTEIQPQHKQAERLNSLEESTHKKLATIARPANERYGKMTTDDLKEAHRNLSQSVATATQATKKGMPGDPAHDQAVSDLAKFKPRLDEADGELKRRIELARTLSRLRSIKASRESGNLTMSEGEMRELLAQAGDVYRDAGVRPTGGRYPHSPDLFRTSDLTGAKIRRYVTLPDGRIAHPDELHLARQRGRLAVVPDSERPGDFATALYAGSSALAKASQGHDESLAEARFTGTDSLGREWRDGELVTKPADSAKFSESLADLLSTLPPAGYRSVLLSLPAGTRRAYLSHKRKSAVRKFAESRR